MSEATTHAVLKGQGVFHDTDDGDSSGFRPVFSGWRKVGNLAGIGAWLAALGYFWLWWFQPDHVHTIGRFVTVTVILLWVTLVPAYFIFIFAAARVPVPRPSKRRSRVAMVVTRAPSEPFAVVAATLEAMLNQAGVAHDTWLADEDPTAEIREWCERRGVKISCRKGIADYHRTSWPRRTRCKEGNLAYFYDTFGYDAYDIVAQFDCDHRPEPDYLRHAVAPFADPAVGYVSAPSICDANAGRSWSARGRLHVEASLHGALQAGYNSGWAPLCIGSHYTVRTAALRQVGGLGPELAEDHSTTLIMNAGGWRGVHAIDAIAHGDGPENFADLVVQEFQWSRSLVTILLQYSATYLANIHGKRRFQFLFSQLWYPAFSLMMLMSFLLPIVALSTGTHFVNVTYVEFFLHILPLSIVMLALAWWWRTTGLFRPADAAIISWEGMAFLFLRWPWSLFGSIMAVRDRLAGGFVDFRITPKATGTARPIPFRVIAPYVVLSAVSGLTVWSVEEAGTADGFYFFTLANAVIYGVLVVVVLVLHARENGVSLFARSVPGLATGLSVAVLGVITFAAALENGAKGLAAMNIGIAAFTLTERVYAPAGAGQGRPGKAIVRLKPEWHGLDRNGDIMDRE